MLTVLDRDFGEDGGRGPDKMGSWGLREFPWDPKVPWFQLLKMGSVLENGHEIEKEEKKNHRQLDT